MKDGEELWMLGAVDGARRIARHEIKPSEWMASVVARIDGTNPQLNAITLDLTEQAMAQAVAADDRAGEGSDLPPLFGVPVTIKENVDIADQPTTNGIPAFKDVVATENAPLVDRLIEAGAIVIGRTNTPEFSMRATTDNPLRGRTVNPWGSEIAPGGSSGGAGAAAAAGMGPIHHGNDIGGSLRFPAFANGVTTVKPTSCRVPVFNSTAAAERGPLAQVMSVQGVIARHTTDIRAATRLMIAPDIRDPMSPPVPWNGPAVAADGEPITVAVTTESAGYDLHPGIAALIDRAAAALAEAGYRVVQADPPPIIDAARGWFSAATTEMKTTFDEPLRAFGSDTIIQIFDWYFELSELLDLSGYITTVANRTALMRDWNQFLDRHPLVITPFLMRPMFDHDYDASGLDAVADLFASAVYSTGINYLGLPAGVIGMDLVDDRPAAVQIVGRYFREDVICDALEAIESVNGVMARQLWAGGDGSTAPDRPQ